MSSMASRERDKKNSHNYASPPVYSYKIVGWINDRLFPTLYDIVSICVRPFMITLDILSLGIFYMYNNFMLSYWMGNLKSLLPSKYGLKHHDTVWPMKKGCGKCKFVPTLSKVTPLKPYRMSIACLWEITSRLITTPLAVYLSAKPSNCMISQILEAARFVFRIAWSLLNLNRTLTATPQFNYQFSDFETSRDLTTPYWIALRW